jgi:hypothetical protein
MTTERKAVANRANWEKSTGPRTQAGKKRASLNSRRHGLTIPIRRDVEQGGEISELVTELAKAIGKLDRIDLAVAAAEAELELARIRHARTALIELSLSSLVDEPHRRCGIDQGHANETCCVAAEASRQSCYRTTRGMVAALPQLEKLERYERRALSRHKKAWRRLLD